MATIQDIQSLVNNYKYQGQPSPSPIPPWLFNGDLTGQYLQDNPALAQYIFGGAQAGNVNKGMLSSSLGIPYQDLMRAYTSLYAGNQDANKYQDAINFAMVNGGTNQQAVDAFKTANPNARYYSWSNATNPSGSLVAGKPKFTLNDLPSLNAWDNYQKTNRMNPQAQMRGAGGSPNSVNRGAFMNNFTSNGGRYVPPNTPTTTTTNTFGGRYPGGNDLNTTLQQNSQGGNRIFGRRG